MSEHNKERIYSEVAVSGTGRTAVLLNRPEAPFAVIVAFKHRHHHHHSCDPKHDHDKLDWRLEDGAGLYLLVLEYSVSEPREVVCEAIYYK